MAIATGAAYLPMDDNNAVAHVISQANEIAAGGRPVIVGVRIDFSKKTAFTPRRIAAASRSTKSCAS